MTYWAQLLHFYQPPWQSHEIIRKVADESYRPVLAILREYPGARIAVNINAVLTQLLAEHGLGDIVDGLRELGERGQVEFTGSGRYHPILPLIPEAERRRSITENAQVNGALIGRSYATAGFFAPELCYSAEIVPAVVESGHRWMLLPGVACPGEWPTRYLCRAGDESARLDVLFRDDVRSNRISFRQTTPCGWLEDLSHMSAPGERAYVMTAMDAETYGHHIKDWERDFLAATYARIAKPEARRESDQPHGVAMVQPSELFDLFPAGPVVEPHASSWSTMPEDLADGNPYPLWAAPGNETHAMQWEFCDHAIAMAAVAAAHAGRSTEAQRFAQLANEVLQPALHSCQFWWASRRPHFDVPMIHPGFAMLDKALRYAAHSIQAGEAPAAVKREAGWRVAAANDLRARFERVLFLGQDA